MVIKNTPLVSITVGTYNSSKYVLETLESIKAQTYQNIELIVSDDCSSDNTVALCKQWIKDNDGRFVRSIILESSVNTGVAGNGNRARRACNGEWVKGIAGDDLLFPNCIEAYIDYVNCHPNEHFIFSRIKAFGSDEETISIYDNKVFDYSFFKLSASEQNHRLIFEGNCIPAATFFYNLSILDKIGIYNDERIQMLEDWPKWINITSYGYKLTFMDKITVNYRIHPNSLSCGIKSEKFYESNRRFYFLYRFRKLYKYDEEMTIEKVITDEYANYSNYLKYYHAYQTIKNSYPYKIGRIVLAPFKLIRNLLS